MIVYNDIKRQFVNDVKDNSLAVKILDAIKRVSDFYCSGVIGTCYRH